jgi:hypothetical protein
MGGLLGATLPPRGARAAAAGTATAIEVMASAMESETTASAR